MLRGVPVNGLLDRYGGDQLVQRVVNRLRCATPRCGKAPFAVRLRSCLDHVPEVAIREVALVGPGAF